MTEENKELKKVGRKRREHQLSLAVVVAEMKAGKTARQIAETYGFTTEGVRRILRVNGIDIKGLRAYKEHKADLFAFKQKQIIEAMSPEKIKGASLRDQATTLNILHNAERLERGQSTSNVSLNQLTASLEEIDRMILEEESRQKK